MEKFTLINKDRSRIKGFEPFEDLSKPSPSIDAMMISYGCVYKKEGVYLYIPNRLSINKFVKRS